MGALALLIQRAVEPIRALGMSAASYAAIGLLSAAGAAFLLAALFMLVAESVGPMGTAALFGFVLLLVAAAWATIVVARAREAKRRRREAAASTAMMASSLTLANTGLRVFSRGGSRLLFPLAGVAVLAWLMNRGGDDD